MNIFRCGKIVYEWANFNQANQLCDELAKQFITQLHQMVENCEFSNLKKEMIWNQLVINVWDAQLPEHRAKPHACQSWENDLSAVCSYRTTAFFEVPYGDTKSQLHRWVSRNTHMKQQRYTLSKKSTKAWDQSAAGPTQMQEMWKRVSLKATMSCQWCCWSCLPDRPVFKHLQHIPVRCKSALLIRRCY